MTHLGENTDLRFKPEPPRGNNEHFSHAEVDYTRTVAFIQQNDRFSSVCSVLTFWRSASSIGQLPRLLRRLYDRWTASAAGALSLPHHFVKIVQWLQFVEV